MTRAVTLTLIGFVQGVGLRPWLGRLAKQCQLSGWVRNSTKGAELWLEGDGDAIERFLGEASVSPDGEQIVFADRRDREPEGTAGFRIRPSDREGVFSTRVPPDRGICDACRAEIRDPAHRRYRDPFATCASCGPRFTILEALPYDRERLSLKYFPRCICCEHEYHAFEDRRYHVEGIACPSCGLLVEFLDRNGQKTEEGDEAIHAAVAALREGRILALKGVGGFQLLVSARNAEAVRRLRLLKDRGTKPFAVMIPSLEWLTQRIAVTPEERDILRSPANPIVLLDTSEDHLGIACEVTEGLGTVGVFPPSSSLHQLLLDELGSAVVATSGNRGDEPIVREGADALHKLAGIADVYLLHNRPIFRRADDSVIRVIDRVPVSFRLGRGDTPRPLPALERLRGRPPILAVGGQQKCALAIWTGQQAILGPHIGDLDSETTREVFAKSASDLCELYNVEPTTIACDRHPDYASTRWAEATGRRVVRVQHHHAHAAAVLVEHDRLDAKVLALTWDGTGFGTDGTIWGGEAMLATVRDFQRVASLLPFPLPGGGAAIREPRRAAFGMLAVLLGPQAAAGNERLTRRLGFTNQEAQVLARMIERGINSPWTSSLGRLFDGVSALLLGLHQVDHEGEAAQRLEDAIRGTDAAPIEIPLQVPEQYVRFPGDRRLPRGDWRPLLQSLWNGVESTMRVDVLAARFHASLAHWGASIAAGFPGVPVVLGGGCFQNKRLRELLTCELRRAGRTVFAGTRIPPGDGGLGVGQLAVAMVQLP